MRFYFSLTRFAQTSCRTDLVPCVYLSRPQAALCNYLSMDYLRGVVYLTYPFVASSPLALMCGSFRLSGIWPHASTTFLKSGLSNRNKIPSVSNDTSLVSVSSHVSRLSGTNAVIVSVACVSHLSARFFQNALLFLMNARVLLLRTQQNWNRGSMTTPYVR